MQLGNLDNEVIFKKAFTDKFVFKSFVRDILGIDFEVGLIETEKKFNPPIGYIDFELDIYAESVDKRICIELQRIEYDHHFDRFLHYFLMLIAEQQKSSKEYMVGRTVYVIVLLTGKYTISEKNGQPILDEVLLLNLNPQTLTGKVRELYGHKFVCLNPNYPDQETPPQIRDWLDLIYQSIHNAQQPDLNTQNEGVMKAAELINFDNLSPAERAESKQKEAGRITMAKMEQLAKKEEKIEIAKKLIKRGMTNDDIAEDTELSIEEIKKLRKDLNGQ